MEKYQWHVEHTDTFSGEPNYVWVRRYKIVTTGEPSQRVLMRAAKKAAGLSGIRGVTDYYGDSYTFRPHGLAQIMFVTFDGVLVDGVLVG